MVANMLFFFHQVRCLIVILLAHTSAKTPNYWGNALVALPIISKPQSFVHEHLYHEITQRLLVQVLVANSRNHGAQLHKCVTHLYGEALSIHPQSHLQLHQKSSSTNEKNLHNVVYYVR